jgi:hypothetical protein
MNRRHLQGILSRDCGNDGASIDAKRGKSLQIRLNSRASSGVRPGDGERPVELHGQSLFKL